MLRRRTLIAISLTLAAAGAQAAATVGQPAPDFSARDATGKTVRLSDFRGKTVVLEWTNPGCPFVRKHYDSGNIPATQKSAVDQGVVWLSVNSTEKAASDYLEGPRLTGWLKERKAVPTAVLMDEEGAVGHTYGARTTPHLYIVNAQGSLVYAGGIDSIASARPADIDKATNYVKAALADVAAGKPIAAATTQPYGCSIKYKSPA
ncbi:MULTISPECIES: redoxin domain-containing protein [unclassified Acidovorax]|uniref:redoxin domain-containing protein n=1 Tax=unclassified Acidovorax TaxID=2684926 RepID=UPI0028834423|nr:MULTISPECIES: redoxin domain-containing protein [unclassified Acidovorax]